MGLGDWLMASAEAKKFNEETGCRVVFGDGNNIYWSEIFEGNPRVTKEPEDGEKICWVGNFPGCRPYIKAITPTNLIYEESFKAEPGEIYLPRSRTKYPSICVVEPNVKEKWYPGMNKAWEWDNWQNLVDTVKLPWVQLGVEGVPSLKGVRRIVTPTFKDALLVLSQAKLLVTTDGALHHAAAAMDIPAVVLWGGLASPKNLGYYAHTNLWHGAEPCGTFRKVCDHCRAAMADISVEEVKQAIERTLEAR